MGNKIDVYWRQYFMIIIAFLGWATATNVQKIDILVLLGVSVCICLFFLFNAIGLLRVYALMIIAVKELSDLAAVTHFYSSLARNESSHTIVLLDFSNREKFTVLIHFFSALLLLLITWSKY